MKNILLLLTLIALPLGVFAQTGTGQNPDNSGVNQNPSNAIRPIDNNIIIGVTGQKSDKAKLTVLAKRKNTNRALGSAKLTLTDGNETKDITLDDPPNPNGQAVFEVAAGKYTLTASRPGYESIPSQQVDLSSKDTKLTINFIPNSGTPDPKSDYEAYVISSLIQQLAGQSVQNFPYAAQTPWQSQNPYSNNGYYNPQYSPNSYMLTADQQSIIPVVVKLQTQALIGTSQNTSVSIIDPLTNNAIDLAENSPAFNNNISPVLSQILRNGCLRPNSNYILRVNSNQQYYFNRYQQNPSNDTPFRTGTYGTYTEITIAPPASVYYGGTNLAAVSAQILPLQNANQISITCPSTYNASTGMAGYPIPGAAYNQTSVYGTQSPYGTTTWADPTVNPTNFGNYHVEQNQTKTGYFLVSNVNMYDQRQIKFVKNSSSNGGLAFVPAESGNFASSYSSQWYATTYTKDTAGQVNVNLTKFSRVNFSLEEYQQAVSGQPYTHF